MEDFNGNDTLSPPLPPLPTLPPLSMIATKTSAADLKMSAEDKEQAIIWAESLTIDDIVLTENRLDVHTLGGKEWGPLPGYVRRAFMKINRIPYWGRKDESGKVVSNHINNEGAKKRAKLGKTGFVAISLSQEEKFEKKCEMLSEYFILHRKFPTQRGTETNEHVLAGFISDQRAKVKTNKHLKFPPYRIEMLNKIHPGILDIKKKYDKHYDLAKKLSNENTHSLKEVSTIEDFNSSNDTLSPPLPPPLPTLPSVDTESTIKKRDVYPHAAGGGNNNSKKKDKEQAMIWAESLTIDDIVLTKDGQSVHTLDGKEWGPLPGYVRRAFMKKNRIQVPQNMRKDDELGKVVSNHINNPSFFVKKLSKEEKEQAIMWAESLTINDVVLTENRLDVHTLDGKEWDPLRVYIKRAFMEKANIQVPQNMRKELGKVVSNHIMRCKKKEISKEEKDQAIIWAESLTIADIVLTENKLDVYTLGDKKWGPLHRYVKLTFMKKNNIIVPQYKEGRDAVLGKVVSNHINPQACPLPKDEPYVKESQEDRFERHCRMFSEFFILHGKFPTKKGTETNEKEIANFITVQRSSANKPTRIEMLNKIHPGILDAKKKHEKHFDYDLGKKLRDETTYSLKDNGLEGEIASLKRRLGLNITTKNEVIQRKDAKLAAKDKALISKDAEIAMLQDTLKNKNIDLAAKEEEIKSVNASLSAYRHHLVSKDEQIASLSADIEDFESAYSHEIDRLRDELAVKDKEISSLQTSKDEEIASLKDTLKNKNAELVELEAEIESVNGQYVKLDDRIKQLSEKDGEIAWLKGTLMNKDEEIALLNDDLKNKNDLIAAKDEEIASSTAVCPPSKRRRIDVDVIHPKMLTVQLSKEHDSCSICLSKYSTDINSGADNIKNHLPVLSASSKSCDHYFCHGCILKQQAAIVEENGGKIPRWISCMTCRTKTAFCPSEPKYHRVLIDILKKAKWTDAPLVKEEKMSD